jgi:hypothetical protein
MVSKVLCISYIMDLNVLCVSCVVVAMARTTRKGAWDVGDNDVNGGWLWIPNVMVLDQRGRIGDCPGKKDNSYFLLAEYMPLLHLF